MFFMGALLKDPEGLLESPGANSHGAPRMAFYSVGDVVEMEGWLRAFIADAFEIEKGRWK